jgi:hypothetical protein
MRSLTSYLRLIGVLTPEDLGRLTKEWYEESSPSGKMKWPDKVRSFDAFMRQRYPNEFLQYKTYTRLLGETHKE